jgi:hypothetical protein
MFTIITLHEPINKAEADAMQRAADSENVNLSHVTSCFTPQCTYRAEGSPLRVYRFLKRVEAMS